MRKIKLKFLGTGYNDYFQATVKIYNQNELLIKEKTYNGELTICIEENKVYKLNAVCMNEEINICFYVDNYRKEYTFIFNRYIKKNRLITFYLTDFNYENLPIMKGEMSFWQKQ